MNLLALETSGRTASLALAERDAAGWVVLDTMQLAAGERAATALHPALDALLKAHGLSPHQLDVIGVAVGPGSFTGLRIGVTTAKTLAYATGANIIGVSTLDCLASGARANVQASQRAATPLVAMLNAQRGEYFVASYPANVVLPRRRGDYQILAPAQIVEWLANDAWLVGPNATSVASRAIDMHPSAEQVAELAWHRADAGDFDDYLQLMPDYGRLSAAEEKANSR
jgi:tRNA threonylcarbamoyladenosine biosynthesis protein TsaB